ncbi:unnamed protein product [Lasius platythorax]|uniref:MADF domain-containing protein n=1 Tax=Lasius platythorax TaxID=488582 RepID=A0AAV2NLF1_9HYME
MSDKENTQEENIQVDEAFGELLANFVRKNPCLYDKKCKEYKDKKFIADTWSSIANACGMSVDVVQKQWKSLRNQFTREHRLENMYEPSGTGNDTKRPRKTWYLYYFLLFLAPHVAHRKSSSNFVRRSAIITPSPSTSQSALQSASESSYSNLWTQNLFNDDSNASTPLSETSTPSEYSANSDSSATSTLVSQPRLAIPKKNLLVPPPDQFASRKRSYKEQEQLSLMIGNTNEAINKLVHNLSEKCSQPVSDDKEDGEEAAIAKAFLYALKKF